MIVCRGRIQTVYHQKALAAQSAEEVRIDALLTSRQTMRICFALYAAYGLPSILGRNMPAMPMPVIGGLGNSLGLLLHTASAHPINCRKVLVSLHLYP